MTSTGRTFMGLDSHTSHRSPVRPRDRLRGFLRDQYRGEHSTKRLAGDIGCTAKTAENILTGHWPNDLHFAAIVRRFGRDVWDAVFLPEIAPVLARLTEEERRLDHELQVARARRRQAEGRSFSDPGSVEASDAEGGK